MAKIGREVDVDVTALVAPTPVNKAGGVSEANIRIDGAYIEYTGENIIVREVRRVSGLSGANPEISALFRTPGIPLPNGRTYHTEIHGLPCRKSWAEMHPKDPTEALVHTEWGYPDYAGMEYAVPPNDLAEPDIEVSTTMASIQTNYHYDDDGNYVPIILEQAFIIEDPDTQTSTTKTVRISPVVEVQVPMTTFIYRRKENWTRTQGVQVGNTVSDLARWYVGRVNSTQIFGDELYTWMCTKIIGVRDMQRSNWVADVVYEFQFNPLTWKTPVSILDDHGYPHPDSIEGEGKMSVRTHPAKDFSRLELRF